jgi:hypothetical protein
LVPQSINLLCLRHPDDRPISATRQRVKRRRPRHPERFLEIFLEHMNGGGRIISTVRILLILTTGRPLPEERCQVSTALLRTLGVGGDSRIVRGRRHASHAVPAACGAHANPRGWDERQLLLQGETRMHWAKKTMHRANGERELQHADRNAMRKSHRCVYWLKETGLSADLPGNDLRILGGGLHLQIDFPMHVRLYIPRMYSQFGRRGY